MVLIEKVIEILDSDIYQELIELDTKYSKFIAKVILETERQAKLEAIREWEKKNNPSLINLADEFNRWSDLEYYFFENWWNNRRDDNPRTAITSSLARNIAILVFDTLKELKSKGKTKGEENG